MSTDKLYSIVDFSGIPLGGTQTLPHGLQVGGIGPLVPDLVFLQFQNSFELVSATTTDLTIRNTSNATGDCRAMCHAIHPVERSFGLPIDDGTFQEHMTPQPFVPGSPNGSAGGGGDSYVVVFRPGGVAAQNVATIWADALAKLAAFQGTRVLEFDDSVVSPIVIPVGGSYDMTGVIWASVPDRIVEVEVPEGVTFTKLRAFNDRINVTFTGATPPVADFVSAPPQLETVTIDAGATVRSTGTGPFFSVGDAATFLIGAEGALLTGTHAVVDVPAAVTLSVFVQGPSAILAASTFSGIVGSTLNLITANDSVVVVSETQAAFLGTKNLVNATVIRTFPTDILVGVTLLASASQMVRVNPTGGAFAVTLPPAAGLRGQPITFKNVSVSTNNVTVTANAGDTVEGAATLVLSGSRFNTTVVSDGVSAWWVTVPEASVATNVFNQGVAIANNPHTFVNFSGDGVNAFDNGGGEAKVVIPRTGVFQWGSLDIDAGADTRFLGPGQNATALTTDEEQIVAPFNCTLGNLFIRHNLANGNGQNVVYTVLVNGVATAVTVTLATGAVGTGSDTSNSVAASAGDTISIRAVKGAGIASGVLNVFATLAAL